MASGALHLALVGEVLGAARVQKLALLMLVCRVVIESCWIDLGCRWREVAVRRDLFTLMVGGAGTVIVVPREDGFDLALHLFLLILLPDQVVLIGDALEEMASDW